MGYQIDYQDSEYKKVIPDKQKMRRRTYLWAGIFVIVLIVIAIFPHIKTALMPGDVSVTEAAFNNFAEEIKEGANIKDAFSGFCKEIIAGAEMS